MKWILLTLVNRAGLVDATGKAKVSFYTSNPTRYITGFLGRTMSISQFDKNSVKPDGAPWYAFLWEYTPEEINTLPTTAYLEPQSGTILSPQDYQIYLEQPSVQSTTAMPPTATITPPTL